MHSLPTLPSTPSSDSSSRQAADTVAAPTHPLGSKARVLLCSVFGPYAQDDEYGSRRINPMELYHNQVTRTQGPFSLRMFHRSWGIMLIQANITAPCTLLDFPTRDRFIQELDQNPYDVIGITSIIPNVGKVKHMVELIRARQPNAVIVVGGHLANMPNLAEKVGCDHAVRGEGVRWFRTYLGEKVDRPINHPRILSGLGARTLGIKVSENPGDVAATLIPSVGCPLGCNFCSTSAMFGGKGKFVNFYETGDELFDVMAGLERDLKVSSFFVMDENFLLHRKRALRLLELMQQNDKSWALYVFSSANVLKSYTIDQLIGLGISWVWMGMEGKNSQYTKLSGADTRELVKTLQSNGVRVLGSTIIGLEEHTPENIDAAIDYAVEHDTEFHQFMLYTPIPGTPLWAEHGRNDTLVDPDCTDVADTHGQFRFNYKHKSIPAGMETQFLIRAFDRDFQVNGPSIARVARTTLLGYQNHKNHPDKRVRRRFHWEAQGLATTYAAAVWAMRHWYRNDPKVYARLDSLLKAIYQEFGLKARLAAAIGGRWVYRCLKQEDQRLKAGWTYEPPTYYETANMASAGNPAAKPVSLRLTPPKWACPQPSVAAMASPPL